MHISKILPAVAIGLMSVGTLVAQRQQFPTMPTITKAESAVVEGNVTAPRAVHRLPMLTGDEVINVPAPTNKLPLKSGSSIFALVPGADSVGFTSYDFQTNAAMGRRILNWGTTGPQGILASLFWMASSTYDDGAYANRGTYSAIRYNDGTKDVWAPGNLTQWQRIEPTRKGWCSIDHLSTGQLLTASHTGINFIKENAAATGNYTVTALTDPTAAVALWPRVAVSHSGTKDVIHLIFNSSSANSDPVAYMRSTDDGVTWEPSVILSGANSITGASLPASGGGDAYAIAANGNNVVVWYWGTAGIVQMRSTDAGATWDPGNAIWVNHYSFTRSYFSHSNPDSVYLKNEKLGDTATAYRTDTITAGGNGFSIILADDGTVRGTFPIYPAYLQLDVPTATNDTAVGRTIYQADFSYTDVAMIYFQEKGGTVRQAVIPLTGGLANPERFLDNRGYQGGFARWGSISSDNLGNTYITYGSGTHNDTVFAQGASDTAPRAYLFSHIYACYTNDDGGHWSPAKDLTPKKVDAQFPSMASLVDNKIYIAYQADTYPGDLLSSAGSGGSTLHPVINSNVEVMVIDKSSLGTVGVNDRQEAATGARSTVTDIMPNPSTGQTRIGYTVANNGPVSIKLCNAIGQEVLPVISMSHHLKGDYTSTFDVSSVTSGAYFVVITSNGVSSSKPFNITH